MRINFTNSSNIYYICVLNFALRLWVITPTMQALNFCHKNSKYRNITKIALIKSQAELNNQNDWIQS